MCPEIRSEFFSVRTCSPDRTLFLLSVSWCDNDDLIAAQVKKRHLQYHTTFGPPHFSISDRDEILCVIDVVGYSCSGHQFNVTVDSISAGKNRDLCTILLVFCHARTPVNSRLAILKARR